MQAAILPVTTADGHGFELRYFEAASCERYVLFFPAMGVPARFYDRFGVSLAERGISIAFADWRGHASSSLRASRTVDWGYEVMIRQDWVAARQVFVSHTGASTLTMGGHSLGGQLSCLYAAAYPDRVQALWLIAACTVHYTGWQGGKALGMRYAVRPLMPLISSLVGYFPGDRIGFAGREARTQMHDWARNVPAGIYHPIGAAEPYESQLNRLAIPVTAISMKGDAFAPYAAVCNLLGKLPACSIEHRHLTREDGVPAAVLDHFKWAKEAQTVAQLLAGRRATGS